MIFKKIENCANQFWKKPAIISDGAVTSYGEFVDLVASYVKKIEDYRLQEHEPVGICLRNSAKFLAILCACEKTGHTAVLLATGFRTSEMKYHIEEARVRYLFCEKQFVSMLEEIGDVSVKEDNSIYEVKMALPDSIYDQYQDGDYFCQVTSGSEGKSKGVIRTAAQVMQEINEIITLIGPTNEDVYLTIPPLSHSYGLIAGGLMPLCQGATVVLVSQFSVGGTLDAIEKYKASMLFLVPFMYELILKSSKSAETDFSSLRYCFSAGSILKESVFKGFYEQTGLYIVSDYGSTETGVMCINNCPQKKLNSVGVPVGNREFMVVDNTGKVLPAGSIGRLRTRSSCNLREYLYPPKFNDRITQDGWLELGDLGYIDEDGYVYVEGRESNMINVGGEKVDPAEVEQLLLKMDGISEVVVLGYQKPPYGEMVKAVVVQDGSVEKNDILKFCKGKIADYKIPKYISYVNEIPKSNTGKILKKYLLEE